MTSPRYQSRGWQICHIEISNHKRRAVVAPGGCVVLHLKVHIPGETILSNTSRLNKILYYPEYQGYH